MIPVNVSLFHCCTRIMSKMSISGCYPGHHTHLSIYAKKTIKKLLNRQGTSTLKIGNTIVLFLCKDNISKCYSLVGLLEATLQKRIKYIRRISRQPRVRKSRLHKRKEQSRKVGNSKYTSPQPASDRKSLVLPASIPASLF